MSNVTFKQSGWGALASVVVTIFVYFVSQLFGSFLIIGVANMMGWGSAQINSWIQSVFPQFLYVLFVESTMLAMLWWFLRSRDARPAQIGLVKPQLKDLGYVALGLTLYFPLLIATMAAISIWLPQINLNQSQQVGFAGAHGPLLILAYISLAILPPIAEEILVRGFLYTGLTTKLPKFFAALLASLMFAAAHLQIGSGASLLWVAAADTFMLSMVLIYLRQKTGSLWSAIGVHMVKNSVAFAALFIFAR